MFIPEMYYDILKIIFLPEYADMRHLISNVDSSMYDDRTDMFIPEMYYDEVKDMFIPEIYYTVLKIIFIPEFGYVRRIISDVDLLLWYEEYPDVDYAEYVRCIEDMYKMYDYISYIYIQEQELDIFGKELGIVKQLLEDSFPEPVDIDIFIPRGEDIPPAEEYKETIHLAAVPYSAQESLPGSSPYVLHVEYYKYLRMILTIRICYFVLPGVILFGPLQRLLVIIGLNSRVSRVVEFITRKYLCVPTVMYIACNVVIGYLSDESNRLFDKGFLETGLGYAAIRIIRSLGLNINHRQTGLLYHYSGIIFIATFYLALSIWLLV